MSLMGRIPQKLKIINRVHVLRAEKRLSQQELADEIEVTRATVNAIESGDYNPSLELALATNSIESLFTNFHLSRLSMVKPDPSA